MFLAGAIVLHCSISGATERELAIKVVGNRVQIQAREVKVGTLLAELAKVVGFELELDPKLAGTVTVSCEGTVDECVRVVLDGLGNKGYAMEFQKDPANALVVRKLYVATRSGDLIVAPQAVSVAADNGPPKRYELVRAKYSKLFDDFLDATGTRGVKDPRAVPDELLASMIESERHEFRLIAAVLLKSRTGKSPAVIKPSEKWDPSISDLLDDLRVLSAETPSYGYVNMDVNNVREFLTAVGVPALPRVQALLADEEQPPPFRSQLLEIVRGLDPETASATAERLARDTNADESLRSNAVRVLASIGGERIAERLARLGSAPGSTLLRPVIRAQLEMLSRAGDRQAAEALEKLKED